MEVEDVSTEEFSDVSQDKEEVFSFDSAQNEQIQELKQKLQDLENDRLPELQKKWKKLESKASSEHRILKAYYDFLKQSIENEFLSERNEAQAELENKRQELRTKLLNDWEEKKRQLEIERNQMDLCGNWMDSFENKTKRRLRPRETKEDQKDDSNPSSANGGLSWLKKQAVSHPIDKRPSKRLGPGLNILLTESEISEDLKMIKAGSRKRSSNQISALPNKKDILVRNGQKVKIGLKWFYLLETVSLVSRDNHRETVQIQQITEKDLGLRKNDGTTIRVSLGKLARDKFKLVRIHSN